MRASVIRQVAIEKRARMPAANGSGSVWWGEATDEPAREDARPTEKTKMTHYPANWKVEDSARIPNLAHKIDERHACPVRQAVDLDGRLQRRIDFAAVRR